MVREEVMEILAPFAAPRRRNNTSRRLVSVRSPPSREAINIAVPMRKTDLWRTDSNVPLCYHCRSPRRVLSDQRRLYYTTHRAEPTVTSNIYLDMLQLYAVPKFPEGVIFQEDGAPPHYGYIFRAFLDTTFPQWWIGRGAVMAWPPRSPDIDPPPLDFYLWSYVKQHVYSDRINDINHLKQRTMDVIHSVTPDVLTHV
ncbi:hypothetical protein AVEN_38088-1 [Araneus ventricosus]|uniref:Uncharacterized protein n=1 Tax=Araneus ventricosus TaxID=182803 RepID=A0A4Y2REP4_ARAVE|nr:hypothetical protein AVEN_213691-1 [Araneus ventricosus]GBN74130.1 hypothetical protein AVEN_38088-1 [Araneus ventricosus]